MQVAAPVTFQAEISTFRAVDRTNREKYAILSVREKARQMRNKKPHILRDGGENALFGEGSAETDYTADH